MNRHCTQSFIGLNGVVATRKQKMFMRFLANVCCFPHLGLATSKHFRNVYMSDKSVAPKGQEGHYCFFL